MLFSLPLDPSICPWVPTICSRSLPIYCQPPPSPPSPRLFHAPSLYPWVPPICLLLVLLHALLSTLGSPTCPLAPLFTPGAPLSTHSSFSICLHAFIYAEVTPIYLCTLPICPHDPLLPLTTPYLPSCPSNYLRVSPPIPILLFLALGTLPTPGYTWSSPCPHIYSWMPPISPISPLTTPGYSPNLLPYILSIYSHAP